MDESNHRKNNNIEKAGVWMFVEFLGHKRLAGFVSEEEKWGQVLMRIDIPTLVDTKTGKLKFTTQFYGTHALYCATPINETDAIKLAKELRPVPFSKYDLHKEANRNMDDYRFAEIDEDDDNDDLPF
uniref:Uncharacterized protein n=1 Tax=viral metagenome TaxID=1070528 RepID=A0A6M3LY67_9ZZZZ